MILVDTSVWIDHFRRRSDRLARLLDEQLVLCHPFIVGELALGSLKNRREVLTLLSELPEAPVVSHADALGMVERRQMAGRGIGWIDAHLLASALVSRSQLWTSDGRLAGIATAVGVSAGF